MTAEQAIQTVNAERARLEIDEEMELESAELAVVEHMQNPDVAGCPTDRIAWIVTFISSWGFVRVHVDDQTGKSLNAIHSA